MDRGEILERLHAKAQLTDKLIEQLKSRIEETKTYQVARNEAEMINRSLKEQIATLRNCLIEKEKATGVKQYYDFTYHCPLSRETTLGSASDSTLNTKKNITNGISNSFSKLDTSSSNMKKDDLLANSSVQQEHDGKKKEKGKSTPKKEASKPVDISRVDFRIGRIMAIKKHPEADKLFVSEVDIGEEKIRTVCSGLVNYVRADEMAGRLVVLMCNLKPVKMRGISSEAMIMCASSPDKVEVLNPPENSEPGDRISCPGYEGDPDTVLNPKHKVFETVQPDLKTNENRIACYKNIPLQVANKGTISAPSLANTSIR